MVSPLRLALFSLLPLLFPSSTHCSRRLIASESADPVPATWPLQFHSTLLMNNSGTRQIVELWYDWPNGRNFNIIQKQLGELLYDLEWDNGTSYNYTLDANRKCRVLHFPVGILRPNWLQGANYLGQQYVDGFLCNVWEKVDFIWYYEDVVSKRPVSWQFFSGMTANVMTFEVGRVLEDPEWQAPVYCFKEADEDKKPLLGSVANGVGHGSLMRGLMSQWHFKSPSFSPLIIIIFLLMNEEVWRVKGGPCESMDKRIKGSFVLQE